MIESYKDCPLVIARTLREFGWEYNNSTDRFELSCADSSISVNWHDAIYIELEKARIQNIEKEPE